MRRQESFVEMTMARMSYRSPGPAGDDAQAYAANADCARGCNRLAADA